MTINFQAAGITLLTTISILTSAAFGMDATLNSSDGVEGEGPAKLDGSYQIRNKKHNDLLRPRNANNSDGTPIVLYSPQPWKCMSWRLKSGPQSSYQLINYFTSKTFQPASAELSAAVIQATPKQDAQKQFWQFVPVGDHLFRIVNLETGNVLTAYEKSSYEVIIQLSPWENKEEQKWELLDLPVLTM